MRGFPVLMRSSVCSGQDGCVGIDEEKENHAEDHEIGVDAEENAAVIPAPAWAHAANVVDRSNTRGERRKSEQRGGMVFREVRKKECDWKAEKDQKATTEE